MPEVTPNLSNIEIKQIIYQQLQLLIEKSLYEDLCIDDACKLADMIITLVFKLKSMPQM